MYKISDGEISSSTNNKTNDNLQVIHSQSFVRFNILGDNLVTCTNCNETSIFVDIIDEKRMGLASVFTTKCIKCITMNTVGSDKRHASTTFSYLYNISPRFPGIRILN